MCGIAGIISGSVDQREKITEQMLRCMSHRGPDDSGVYTDHIVAFGANRLAIQDLSHAGHQPMTSPDGRFIIAFNGEIYNHKTLRAELAKAGYSFNSDSDTETLLYAMIHWGEAALTKLNGIFCFALYDKDRKQLLIARDRMGVKPLYYYSDENICAFASELKSLTGIAQLDYSIAPECFYNYLLLLYQPLSHTPFRNILKLMPGHLLRLDCNGNKPPYVEKWATALAISSQFERDEQAAVQHLKTLLRDAVEMQLQSDAPVGFFLSGGLDSSLLVAIAAKDFGMRAPCFTTDTQNQFSREGFDDDLPYARQVAELLRLPLHIDTVHAPDASAFDRMIYMLDEPQADAAALNVWSIAQRAHQQGIKVLLSGTGADDIFSGYRRHQALKLISKLRFVSPAIRNILSRVCAGSRHPMLRRAAQLLRNEGRNGLQLDAGTFFWQRPSQVIAIMNHQQDIRPYEFFEQVAQTEHTKDVSRLRRMLLWEQHGFLPHHNLNYLDKMTMAASVEGRVPYLDNAITGFAATLPDSLLMKGRTTKYLLRKAAAEYLPDHIIHRRKTGFGAPVRQWICGPMKDMAIERLTDDSIRRRSIFSVSKTEKLLQDTFAGRRDASYTIWSMLAIESWQRQFADKHI